MIHSRWPIGCFFVLSFVTSTVSAQPRERDPQEDASSPDAPVQAPQAPPPAAPAPSPSLPAAGVLPPSAPALPIPPQPVVPVAPAPERPSPFRVKAIVEGGFIDPLFNIGAFGERASRFDFIRDGGQKNLYFYSRWSGEVSIHDRHTLVFLYQPLELESSFTPDREIRERGAVLPAGRPARVTFGFPFYRFSYLYDVLPSRASELAFGFTGQIRNASYTFETLDGAQLGTVRSVGFVPAFKVRGRHTWDSGVFAGFEIDGVYAPLQYINGSDNETTGAILDASLRAGLKVDPRVDAFFNVRYLGGGATREGAGSESSKNWVHILFVGLGASLELTRPR